MATIELLFKDKSIDNYPIGVGDSLLIGRNAVNDIVINNLAVSAQHAKIESIGHGFLFVDLQSENGSFINDQHTKSHWLNHGDTITIGKHILKFSSPNDKKPDKINQFGYTKTMQIDTRKFREMLNRNQNNKAFNGKTTIAADADASDDPEKIEQIGVLSYLTGKKHNVQLNAKMIRIGKDANADILVKGLGIGKTSAVINRMPDGWYINYVEGILKPQLNNRALKKSAKLENLDIIKLGSTKLQFLILRSPTTS